jgi:hypothetical protein
LGVDSTPADNGVVAVVAKCASILTTPGTVRVLKTLHSYMPSRILLHLLRMYIQYCMIRTFLKTMRSRK